MGQIIDGKFVAETMKSAIALEVSELINAGKRPPHLVAILVGNNGASETYVANKVKSCEELAASPKLGKSYNEIAPGILGFIAYRHLIFFRKISDKEIEVIRILHGQMDLKNKF